MAFSANVIFPEDASILNKPCTAKNGLKGSYKLIKDCELKNQNVHCIIQSVGFAVCCPKITAKKFCVNIVPEIPHALSYNIFEGDKANVGEFPHMAAVVRIR